MSGLDKALISTMMEGFVTEVPPKPFVSYCEVCHVFLTKEEMVYEKGCVFHRHCFEGHGKEFPEVNHDLTSLNSNTKVQLIQLKNLKVRQQGGLDQSSSAPKPKRKTKRKSGKKRPKRKKVKKRSSPSKREKTKKQSRKKRSPSKRRSSTKRRKKSRRSTTKTRRGVRRRPARRRTSKRRTRRRR